MNSTRLTLYVVCLAAPLTLFAGDGTSQEGDEQAPASGIYRSIDADGNVIFTDKPPESGQAEEVKVREGNIVPGTAPRRPATERRPEPDDEPFRYETLRITSPESEQTFQNPYEPIPVAVEVAPSLRRGHAMVLLVNGEQQPEMKLDAEIYRGAHELLIEVRAGDEVIQQSEPITIFVHRASRLRP